MKSPGVDEKDPKKRFVFEDEIPIVGKCRTILEQDDNGHMYNPRWYPTSDPKKLLIQHMRMLRLAFAMQNAFHRLPSGKMDQINIRTRVTERKVDLLDLVNEADTWRREDRDVSKIYSIDDQQILLSCDERGWKAPVPLPCVEIPRGFRSVVDLPKSKTPAPFLCGLLRNVIDQLLYAVSIGTVPVRLPLKRILVDLNTQEPHAFLACADLAVGPLTTSNDETDHDVPVVCSLQTTIEKLLEDVAKSFNFPPMSDIVTRGKTHHLEGLTHRLHDRRIAAHFTIDAYKAALSVESEKKSCFVYLDAANLKRSYLKHLDYSVRWGQFLRQLPLKYPEFTALPITKIISNRRTWDEKKYKKFFSSLRRFNAIVDREFGSEKGDSSDDERIDVLANADLEAKRAQQCILISADSDIKEIQNRLRRTFGRIDCAYVISTKDARFQELFRGCVI